MVSRKQYVREQIYLRPTDLGTVAEFDDYPRQAHKMIEQMDWFKGINPLFKATLYGIPAEMKPEHWKMVDERKDWLRVGAHGFEHRRRECYKFQMKHIIHWRSIIRDMPFSKILKPPFYGYGKRYIEKMSEDGFVMSCRWANDIYRWFDSPLDCPRVRMYCKFEQLYGQMFGHPDTQPYMFTSTAPRINTKVCKRSTSFMFSEDVAEYKSRIYLASGDHNVGFENFDKNAVGAGKWEWGQRLPYADNSVDFVLIQHGLIYAPLEMYEDIFKEIRRVLCTGGRVLIKEDNSDNYIWRPIGRVGVMSHTNVPMVKGRLERAGLAVTSDNSIQLVDKYDKLVNRLNKVNKGYMYLIEAEKKGGW